jgi:hypothetical protein
MADLPGIEAPPAAAAEMCQCGRPLHYLSRHIEMHVRALVAQLGPDVTVRVGDRAWIVSRHYLALHGFDPTHPPRPSIRRAEP